MEINTVVFLAVVFVFIFLLPGLGAQAAFKKNRRGFGIAILATGVLGLGWILAIVALLQSAIQSDQPCPKCGSAKVMQEKTPIDRKTQKRTTPLRFAIFGGVFGVAVIAAMLWMAITTWQEGDSGIIRWTYGSTIAGLAFLAFGVGIGRIGLVQVWNYLKADRAPGSAYTCNECKYTWVTIDDPIIAGPANRGGRWGSNPQPPDPQSGS